MTDILRRSFLRSALSLALNVTVAAAVLLTPQLAGAQSYPTKPLRLVVGFPAGGPNDIQGRMIAQWLSARLGQPVNVDNRPGGSSNPATEEVVRAPADGYTLMLVGPANTINPSLYDNLPFNFLRDIAPVGSVIREPLVMVVHPSVKANTVAEFIALAKANPGALKMASTGKGSSPHVTGLLFTSMTGVDVEVVQYAGGGPALKGMIEGQAQMMFEPMSASIEPVRSGKLRALAVTTTTRSAALPDVPPLNDAVPGYEASALTGIGVPAATPPAIIERLNKDINAGLADAVMKQRFIDGGGILLGGSPADFGKLLAAETEKWAKVIKSAGVKP
jgi:tripartite-type tricarboxylate transporter receptor subunit TctC